MSNSLYTFRGQYYNNPIPIPCQLCHKTQIKEVYTIHHLTQGSFRIGSCCFSRFLEAQPHLYGQLMAARTLLGVSVDGLKADIKVYRSKGDIDHHLGEWKKLKRKAHSIVKDYQRGSKDGWLPKPLFELKAEADRNPGKSLRWYKMHLANLGDMLQSLKK